MNRRRFLHHTALGTAGTFTASASLHADSVPAPTVASRIIDTHVHFYDPTRKEGVPWPGKGTALYRPVYPKDWQAVAHPHGIREVLVLEASEWVADNDWILDLAKKEKCIIGFVGNLEPMKPDFSVQLKRLAANPLFRGIRRAGGVLYDNISNPEFRKGVKQLADLGLSLDTNDRRPGGLQAVAKLAVDLPDLRIIADHCGTCGDAKHLDEDWKSGITTLAAQKNAFCKISGIIELTDEAKSHYGHAPRDTAYYLPILDHCWNSFGPDRLIFGSNWPVCEIGGTFGDQFKIFSEFFTSKGREACEKYFWKNSKVAYQWS
jgi:L-fuconolactonase